jgi:hypothetical protein
VYGAASAGRTLPYQLGSDNGGPDNLLASSDPLGAGDYAAAADISVSSSGAPGTTNEVQCSLVLDSVTTATDSVRMAIAAGTASTVGLMAAEFMGRGSDVTTSCFQASGSGTLSVEDVQQTITLAGAVN